MTTDPDHLIVEDFHAALEDQTSGEKLSSLEGVYLICAYINESSYGILTLVLQNLSNRGPPLGPVPIRIYTTSQFGTTDASAVHKLALLPKVEVKVFTKARDPTFHAKGWLFIRILRQTFPVLRSLALPTFQSQR